MRENFWNETNSCLHNFRYEGGYRGLLVCNKTSLCFLRDDQQAVENMPKANILVIDYRMPSVFSNKNLEKMRKLGIIGANQGWQEYRKRIMRLLLNPSSSNIGLIQSEWKRLNVPKVNVAMHVRCGGLLADHPEVTVMVSPEQLEQIPGQIRQIIAAQHIPPYKAPIIYLSTDSTEAEKRLRSGLPNMKLVTVKSFERDHTVFAGSASLRRAIMDLFLLCKSNVFLGTHGSGFSQVAAMLCKSPKVFVISVNRTRIV